MSLQWTLVAGFLYLEVATVFFFLIPLISPTRWKIIFNSNLVMKLRKKGKYYFYFYVVVLMILMIDAIREAIKYEPAIEQVVPNSFMNNEAANEFRAQRNLYITGMNLFLAFVIHRLVALITEAANLIDELRMAHSDSQSLKNEVERLTKEKGAAKKMEAEEAVRKRGEIAETDC